MELIKHLYWVTGKPNQYQRVRNYAELGMASEELSDEGRVIDRLINGRVDGFLRSFFQADHEPG
jgi:hypothetical protein